MISVKLDHLLIPSWLSRCLRCAAQSLRCGQSADSRHVPSAYEVICGPTRLHRTCVIWRRETIHFSFCTVGPRLAISVAIRVAIRGHERALAARECPGDPRASRRPCNYQLLLHFAPGRAREKRKNTLHCMMVYLHIWVYCVQYLHVNGKLLTC